MPVVLLLAAVAILAGVVVVAAGRGGELAVFRSDAPPLRREFATAADLATWRPPPALFGYSAQATDDALQRIARVVADRDAELAMLRDQLAALRASPGAASRGVTSPGVTSPGVTSPGAIGPGDWAEPVDRADPDNWAVPPRTDHGEWADPAEQTDPGSWAVPADTTERTGPPDRDEWTGPGERTEPGEPGGDGADRE
jgi:hypothetical protein